MNQHNTLRKPSFTPYLGVAGMWALAFGCSVGQGAFVMPGTTFLPIAGPIGMLLGTVFGTLAMLILAKNYHDLMNRFPDSGGTYAYTKHFFGYDHGFLSAWFLILTYIAILWANATALPIVARTLFGSAFRFGFHYQIAGYDIYLGEILLAKAALVASAFVCLRRSLAAKTQILMGVLLLAGVLVCFAAAFLNRDTSAAPFDPPFVTDGHAARGVFTMFALAPWAFAGFESVSHSAEEFRFPLKKTFRILAAALICAAVAYILLTLLATLAVPEGVSDWTEYVARLGSYSGTEAQPTFFASQSALGSAGVAVIGIAALFGIFTGLIGNYIALSRLIHALSRDRMMPQWIGKNDRRQVPRHAILLVLGVSVILPFFGRTAISWIVDVTTVGATIAYAFTSAAAIKNAREQKSKTALVFGAAGLAVSLFFALAFLVPNLISVKTLATESYLILAAWGLLGFIVFYYLLRHDTERRLGRSNVALIVMLSVIIFTSTVWMRQTADNAMNRTVNQLHSSYLDILDEHGIDSMTHATDNSFHYLQKEMGKVESSVWMTTGVQILLIITTIAVLFIIYAHIQKREKQIEVEKAFAEETSRAKTSFLSNMSHEIRTPMNAIIGLDNIALRDPELSPKTRDNLEKIGASANHLLALINDILDMSRIESGRMVLKEKEFCFREIIDQVNTIINGQCAEKGLSYEYRAAGALCDCYYGDDMKIKQVLINILGNAVKFTDAPGTVSLTVEQISRADDRCTLRFVMRDNGAGMDEAYIPQLFEAFSQEDATTTNRYGGSGLGMAITKNYVEMMGGTIAVESQKGVGSVFTVTITLKASDRIDEGAAPSLPEETIQNVLAGKRILMAEDVDANAELLEDLLELEGIRSERACNGQIAVEMFTAQPAGYYDAILMDMRMPVMDGLATTRAIRASEREDAKTIPIIAMTANVFDEDVKRTLEVGMNAHLSKPIEPDRLYATMAELIEANQT